MRDPTTPIHVLMVEDSPTDVELTLLALEDAKVRVDLAVVGDGKEALEYLRREGRHEGAPRPDVVLLDLNLPKLDGHQVLEAIRADESLTLIPVVVLTTSDADQDIEEAYRNRANAYVQKPVDFEQLVKVVQMIDGFWFTVVKYPPPSSEPTRLT